MPSDITHTHLSAQDLRDANRAQTIDLRPDAQTCAELAEQLQVLGLEKLRLSGKIAPQGKADWLLTGRVGATVTQACVVTLEPVRTRVEEDFRRLFLRDWAEPEADSTTEVPEDEDTEALGTEIDLGQIAAEVIALALPAYPRAEGAEVAGAQVSAPGVTPLTDEDVKPFAALASLRDKLQK